MTPVESPLDPDDGIPLRLRVMGVTVDTRTPDEDTRARLARQWSRSVLADDAEVDTMVPGPEATTGEPDSLERRDYYFTTQVTLAGLLATAGERVNLHAGSVADDDGRVLVVVGPSGTGKTTATRALAARLHYLSDETASITPDGVVYPHPKPLSIVVNPDDVTHKQQLSPDDIGLGSTPESGTLHRIVVLHRGVPTPDGVHGLHPLDTVTALMELIEQSSSLGSLDTPLTTLLHVVDATGGVLALEYDEIGDHVEDLIGLLDAATAPAGELGTRPEPVRHPGSPTAEPSDLDPDDLRLHRLPWTDALEVGADLVVLLESRAVRLTELTATVWLHLDEPRTVAELTAWAQQVHGNHPDATEIVEQAVTALARESLVAGGSMS
jgi:hypothetical protein